MLSLSLLSFKVYMLVYRRVDHEEKKGSPAAAGKAAHVQALACDSSHSTPDERTKTQTERSIPTSMVDLVADEAAGSSSEAEQGRKHENLEQEADIEERSDKKMKV
jgi:hypothetical protein